MFGLRALGPSSYRFGAAGVWGLSQVLFEAFEVWGFVEIRLIFTNP